MRKIVFSRGPEVVNLCPRALYFFIMIGFPCSTCKCWFICPKQHISGTFIFKSYVFTLRRVVSSHKKLPQCLISTWKIGMSQRVENVNRNPSSFEFAFVIRLLHVNSLGLIQYAARRKDLRGSGVICSLDGSERSAPAIRWFTLTSDSEHRTRTDVLVGLRTGALKLLHCGLPRLVTVCSSCLRGRRVFANLRFVVLVCLRPTLSTLSCYYTVYGTSGLQHGVGGNILTSIKTKHRNRLNLWTSSDPRTHEDSSPNWGAGMPETSSIISLTSQNHVANWFNHIILLC
jgi:hypothetical protein